MSTENSSSGKELGFSFRRLALVLLALIAFRGATGGVRDFVVNGNWLAGVFGVLIISVIFYWIFNLYASSPSEE
jgi:hypothetical protein